MKKFINILVAAAVTALAVVSCQKAEQVKPGTPDPEGCYGVYFPVQEATGSHTYDPDMDRSITFTVARTNTSGAITVPYTVKTDSEEVFEFEDIVFADGQAETEFEVSFDDIEEGKTCSFSIQLSDDNAYVSHYNTGAIAIDFSVIVVQWQDFIDPKTKEPAVITLNEGWWGEVHMAQLRYYEVAGIRTCVFSSIEEGKGIWGDAVDATLEFTWYTENNNAEGHNFLEVKKQYFGFDYSDWASKPVSEAVNPIYVYDYPWYWIERGYNWGDGDMQDNWLAEANKTGQVDGSYPVGYYDGNGGFFFNLRYYIPGLGGFSPDPYEFVAIASGFTRVDYSLEVETDYPSEGTTPVLFTVGADVDKVVYGVYEGSLNSVQVQARVDAIAEGKEENVQTVSEFAFDEDEEIYYAEVGVAPETTGEYTLVAVSFNKTTEEITKSEAQSSASVTFNHVGAADTEEYAVELEIGLEDIPARYGDFKAFDSFGFYLKGKSITEAHLTIVETEKYVEDIETYNAGVKSGAEGVYILDESTLAEINSSIGFFTYVDGLDALTSYTVLVWATNDISDGIFTLEHTTDGLPNVFITKGDFRYTAFFVDEGEEYADDPDLDLYQNPNKKNTYLITHWGYNVTFNFTMDPETGVITFPYFYSGYTSSTYGPVYVFNAKDYWSAETLEKYPEMGADSYYDSEKKQYNFNLVYAVTAGYFGYGWEYFFPKESNGEAASAVKLQKAVFDKLQGNYEKDFSRKFVSLEREVKAISVETKAVTFNREKKEKTQTSRVAGEALSTR